MIRSLCYCYLLNKNKIINYLNNKKKNRKIN